MSPDHISQLFIGIEEAKRGNTLLGMQLLNGLQEDSPHHLFYEAKAWFSYCLAKEKRDFRQAIASCQDAWEKKPDSSEICLALGRIYLLSGHRSAAIRILQRGLEIDNNREIYRLLSSIGIRKSPVFGFLDRKHRVNIVTGRLFRRIGLR